MALAAGRRARRLLAYWRSEKRLLRQGYVALLIASGGNLLGGLALAAMSRRLELLPGLIVLIPAAIGMRGNIFGALGSRLGTGIHVGLFEATRSRRGYLPQNALASLFLTLGTSLFLGVAARAVSAAFAIRTISTWDFVVISIVGGVLGSVVVGSATVALAILSHRREWDLDAVSAPLVTAIGDTVTLPTLWAATYLAGLRYVTLSVGIATASICLLATIRGVVSDLPLTRRIVRESLPVLFAAGVVDILAGIVVESRLQRFITFPALLILVPPFLADIGALGGILSSRLSSKLHMGLISPRRVPGRQALLDASINFLLAASLFLLLGLSVQLVSVLTRQASPGTFAMVGISLLAGFIATILSSATAYYAAVATFRFGFDPDNHGIPFVTSTMDLAGTVCLVLAIVVFGVGANA